MAGARNTLLRTAIDAQEAPAAAASAYAHEQSLWVGGSVHQDPLYSVEPTAAVPKPGSLLKVDTPDPALFALPPGIAVSRIAYQSEDLSGRAVPTTGYLLWPFCPRKTPDGAVALAVWAHGTTGMFAENAPSRNFALGQHFLAPFPLALAGYAVFAPDYAGLGIDTDHAGRRIVHEFLGHPAQANDVVFGVKAACHAFSILSNHFVIIGHSQGGGVAWGVAQRQAQRPVDGYLGAIAVCPVTNLLELRNHENPLIACLCAFLLPAIAELDAGFSLADVFTPTGLARFNLYTKLEGGIPSGVALLCAEDVSGLVRADWQQHPAIREYVLSTRVGAAPISGPLLVIQGANDPNMSCAVTEAAVAETRAACPGTDLQYVRLEGRGHDDTMYAALPCVLDWVAARFADAGAPLKVDMGADSEPPRPLSDYQQATTWALTKLSSPWQMM